MAKNDFLLKPSKVICEKATFFHLMAMGVRKLENTDTSFRKQ